MNDIDEFFAEQDRRMNIPDEDVDEYIRTRFATARRDQSTGGRINVIVAPHAPINPQQQDKQPIGSNIARGSHTAQTTVGGIEPKLVSHGSFPGPSPTTHDAAPCVKRRKLTGEHAIPIEHDIASETSNLGSLASRTTTRRRNGAVSAYTSAKPACTSVSSRVSQRASGRNSMSSSTDLVLGRDRDLMPAFVQAQTDQTTHQAVLVTKQVSRDSTDANNSVSGMESVQALERQKLNTVYSPPPVSPHRGAAIFNPTPFDGHGRGDKPRIVEDSISANAMTTLTAVPTIVASPSSRIANVSHEAGCTGAMPVPGTPAGFNTAAHLDVSNVTSPADTQPGQLDHTGWGSRVPSTAAQASSSDALIPRGPKARKTVNSGRKPRKTPGNGSNSRQVKDKPKLMTPLEYAQKLQSCLGLQVKTDYLRGKRIFYVGGDMMYAGTTTRGRMEYIVKHGGTLVPKYDPAVVTHIVTDAGVRHTLQALSLKSLSEIPDSIPTVTWDWVISGYGRASKRKAKNLSDKGDKGKRKAEDDEDDNDAFDFEFMHAAFSERIDAGRSWKNGRGGKQDKRVARGRDLAPEADNAQDDSGDISHISTFSQESKPARNEGPRISLGTVLPPPPLDLISVDGGKTEGRATLEEAKKPSRSDDPLAEYYAQARADREAKWSQDLSDSDDEDDSFEYPRGPAPRRGFTCDVKGQKPTVCVNQDIVDKLEELRELHKAKSSEDDRWRAFSYGKCIPALRNYPKRIKSFSEARSIRGVGEKTALKIMEIINTGGLERIKYENTDEVAATKVFQGIYGVGRHTAFTWYASGLRTLDDVRARKGGLKLSTAQEIGLTFYDDINSRMPREEARGIFELIRPIALDIDSKLFIEIMGSYRRGKADCGDIDILITRSTTDGKTHQGVLRTLLERLHATGIVTEDLAVPDDFSDLELVYRGLCKLPKPDAKRRRIDFLCVPWESRGAALLYYTGDDIFNRAMRLKANRHGYSLNQRGLYAGVVRDPHDRQKKVCQGRIVASETEEEIFRILGVPWQEPHERVRG